MTLGLQSFMWEQSIGAIACIGVAAFGLVDASRSVFRSINRIGFIHIKRMVVGLTPERNRIPVNAMSQRSILQALEANWADGIDLTHQKEIARSLILMHLSSDSAVDVAVATNVDPIILAEVAASLACGTQLSPPQSYVYDRFCKIVTSMLAEAYHIANQVYRNDIRTLATFVCVALALAGAWSVDGTQYFFATSDPYLAFFGGLLAAALAPVAKDASAAVADAVKSKVRKAM